MAGVPVKVDLGNATEFDLKVEDGGGGVVFGNHFDQADWADARVTLADGKTVWLGDLPTGPLRAPFTAEVPFSFRYGDQPSSYLLKMWEFNRSSRRLDDNRTEHTLTYTDPKSGLVVRCVAVEYHDFPVVEWTLYFQNTGSAPTPILENIQALDTRFERSEDGEFILHHSKGSQATSTDFEPYADRLERKAEKRISAAGGRPTNTDLCYFNIALPGEGTIVALGWPGQWAAQFTRDEGTGLQVRAGQELTHFKLLPGEEVRSPLVALVFWHGDWIDGQNVWRRWMVAHNLPRPGPGTTFPKSRQPWRARRRPKRRPPTSATSRMRTLMPKNRLIFSSSYLLVYNFSHSRQRNLRHRTSPFRAGAPRSSPPPTRAGATLECRHTAELDILW